MRAHNKGFVLIMVMAFAIATAAGALALYKSISSTYSVVGVKEAERIKGYHAAMAGLRYSMILLKNPDSLGIPGQGDSVTKSIMSDYPALYNDLELKNPNNVTITITNLGNGTYGVTSSYNF